jgi:hypothetical protein
MATLQVFLLISTTEVEVEAEDTLHTLRLVMDKVVEEMEAILQTFLLVLQILAEAVEELMEITVEPQVEQAVQV